jgi:hypothetical protein
MGLSSGTTGTGNPGGRFQAKLLADGGALGPALALPALGSGDSGMTDGAPPAVELTGVVG